MQNFTKVENKNCIKILQQNYKKIMKYVGLMVWLDYKTNDNLSTNCQQIVLVLSYFCLKFVTT